MEHHHYHQHDCDLPVRCCLWWWRTACLCAGISLNVELLTIFLEVSGLFYTRKLSNTVKIILISSVYCRFNSLRSQMRPLISSWWWNWEVSSTGNTWLRSQRSPALTSLSVGIPTELKAFCLRGAGSEDRWKPGGGSCLFSTNVTNWCSTRIQICSTASLICRILICFNLHFELPSMCSFSDTVVFSVTVNLKYSENMFCFFFFVLVFDSQNKRRVRMTQDFWEYHANGNVEAGPISDNYIFTGNSSAVRAYKAVEMEIIPGKIVTEIRQRFFRCVKSIFNSKAFTVTTATWSVTCRSFQGGQRSGLCLLHHHPCPRMLWDQSEVSQAGADVLAGTPAPQHRGGPQEQHLNEEQQNCVHRW